MKSITQKLRSVHVHLLFASVVCIHKTQYTFFMETINATQSTIEIASRFAELCKKGEMQRIQEELFADHAQSLEPKQSPWPSVNGVAAIKVKGRNFNETVLESHGGYVGEPIVAGNHFAIAMGMDVTLKNGNRVNMDEVCVYKVEDGKIVSEQFFY